MTAVEHLIDETVIVGRVVARTALFKPLPVIDENLFEDIPVPSRFDNHQIAPSLGVGCWECGIFYHILPLTSTPHRSSLCPPLPTHLSLSYQGFWDRKNVNSYAMHITPCGRTFKHQPLSQGPDRCALDSYVPRLILSPSS